MVVNQILLPENKNKIQRNGELAEALNYCNIMFQELNELQLVLVEVNRLNCYSYSRYSKASHHRGRGDKNVQSKIQLKTMGKY